MLLYFRYLKLSYHKLFKIIIPYVVLGCFWLFQPRLFSIILDSSTVNYYQLFSIILGKPTINYSKLFHPMLF
jgi:hypothetical protein